MTTTCAASRDLSDHLYREEQAEKEIDDLRYEFDLKKPQLVHDLACGHDVKVGNEIVTFDKVVTHFIESIANEELAPLIRKLAQEDTPASKELFQWLKSSAESLIQNQY